MPERHWVSWKMRRGGFTNAHLAEFTDRTLCGMALPKNITNEVEDLARCRACLNKNAPTRDEVAEATARFKASGGEIKVLPMSLERSPADVADFGNTARTYKEGMSRMDLEMYR